MNMLLHARMQPPHSGHISLIKHFMDKYPESILVISLDVRKKDKDNPFSFAYRKNRLKRKLKNYQNRVKIIAHVCKSFTLNGCMSSIFKTFHYKLNLGEINLVIGGPDLQDKYGQYWKNKGINVESINKRYYGISGKKIRERWHRRNS